MSQQLEQFEMDSTFPVSARLTLASGVNYRVCRGLLALGLARLPQRVSAPHGVPPPAGSPLHLSHHVPLFKLVTMPTQFHGVEKQPSSLDERSFQVTLQRVTDLGRSYSGLWLPSGPRWPMQWVQRERWAAAGWVGACGP